MTLIRRIGLFTAFVMLLSSSFAGAAEKKGKKKKGGAVLMTAEEMKWAEAPGGKTKMAVLWGNPKRGAAGALVKWPAGHSEELHHHTARVRFLVTAGTMWLGLGKDGEKKELPTGSYGLLPGRAKHTAGCKEGAECAFFVQINKKFDFVKAGAKKGKKGKKKATKAEEKKGEKKAE
jgi:quercetin dioxygenase-like cupin family protein